ncbi:MAG: acyltransferase [Desulfovibrio sp.]|jgi:hypothetical protein|nr:acyltransferase [Desulfovibrio sp.]
MPRHPGSGVRALHITMLKTLCLAGVIFAHALLPFVEPTTFVKIYADQPSHIATQVSFWLNFLIIPSFMLASGYVMALTLDRQHRTFIQQVINRVKRLLLPWFCLMVFWMVPLYTLFDLPAYNRPAGFTLAQTYRAGLSGLFTDHLWFLLVLFWISLFWLAVLPLIKRTGILPGFILAVVVSLLMDTYGRELTLYAMWETSGQIIYFYLGYSLYHGRERISGLLEERPLTLMAGNAVCFIIIANFSQFYQILYWIACCMGALLVYQVCLFLSHSVYARLRDNPQYRYFEDNAFRFYLFHLPGGLLIFKGLNAANMLSPLPFILLSFVLNLAATTLIVMGINALEQKWRIGFVPRGQ